VTPELLYVLYLGDVGGWLKIDGSPGNKPPSPFAKLTNPE
jgi:hypothetical protein